jgi:hypothetical protein
MLLVLLQILNTTQNVLLFQAFTKTMKLIIYTAVYMLSHKVTTDTEKYNLSLRKQLKLFKTPNVQNGPVFLTATTAKGHSGRT